MRCYVLLGWALAASLTVNAGLVVSMIGVGGDEDRRGPLGALAAELSRESRAVLRETTHQARPAIRDARGELRVAQRALIATMRAAPEDVDAIAEAMLVVRNANAMLEKQLQRIPLATLLQLEGAERDALIDGLEKSMQRRR